MDCPQTTCPVVTSVSHSNAVLIPTSNPERFGSRLPTSAALHPHLDILTVSCRLDDLGDPRKHGGMQGVCSPDVHAEIPVSNIKLRSLFHRVS